MAMTQHSAGEHATFEAELMLSLEPATITGERYPLLFQTGETAYGHPIIDGQHPHNFIMALGFHYIAPACREHDTRPVLRAGGRSGAGAGRISASRLGLWNCRRLRSRHHWQDSTHIADDVVTAGISHEKVQARSQRILWRRAGRKSLDHRDRAPSIPGRRALWYFPSDNWAAQVSVGRLTHPEALEPGDVVRSTASLSYSRPRASSTSIIWGRNHSTFTHRDLNSYLIESEVPFARKNYITGRAELVDKDELIVPGVYRIGAYVIGYTRDILTMAHLTTGLGGNFTAYSMPSSLDPAYGNHPVAVNVFLRFRLH